jgi:hypothetical protein
VILTDGSDVEDLEESRKMIAERVSQLPLSIICVGIGDRDFSALNALDLKYDYKFKRNAF